jgi:hypothetical protein
MGLDMYLLKTSTKNEVPDYPEVLEDYGGFGSKRTVEQEVAEFAYNKATEGIWGDSEELAYWRKFNALHAWFVDNCQGGVDKCQYGKVQREDLEELFDIIDESIQTKTPKLEPTSGFFFGSTEVDEYYWRDMEETRSLIHKILAETDFDNEQILYCASW